MGVGVSSWSLARAVSRLGQLGVVSGTGLDSVWVRKLQNGDLGRHFERAMKTFPVPEVAEKIYRKYFLESGKSRTATFKRPPMLTASPPLELKQLLMVSNFVEVFLAKEGHAGPVGINYLEKIQMGTLASVYGAMLAGVGYILIGAGIPREIPGVLERLTRHEDVQLNLQVSGAERGDEFLSTFSPREALGGILSPIPRPKFLAIISSSTLALTLVKKGSGVVDGFVVEGATAGGHNAPPRGPAQFNDRGEPLYGPRDNPDLETISSLGLPFWLAGSYAGVGGLERALDLGASGVQVGTAFALCQESGLPEETKRRLLTMVEQDGIEVFTDPRASPTGFPFKVARIPNTLSEIDTYQARNRCCDMGYLRKPYKRDDGKLGYRCPAEPVASFVAKGGDPAETEGRKCLCNALMANIDLGQHQEDGSIEQPLITLGDDVASVRRFIAAGQSSYKASDVIRVLLARTSRRSLESGLHTAAQPSPA